MSKHTKGPWKCNPLDRAHNFKILPAYYDTPVSTDEALANARLIAAAPELLDLCKHLNKELADAGYGAKSTELDELAVALHIMLGRILNNK